MNNNFLPYQLKKTNDTNEALATQLAQNTSRLQNIHVDVKVSFGAKGDWNGTIGTDDTTAIQNAINSLNDGDSIYFPSGVYRTTSTITVSKDIKIIGQDATILCDHSNVGLKFYPSSIGYFGSDRSKTLDVNISVSRKIFDTSSTATGVEITNCSFGKFSFQLLKNHNIGLLLIGDTVNSVQYGTTYCSLYSKRFSDCKTGIELRNVAGWVTENTFYNGSMGADTIADPAQLNCHIFLNGTATGSGGTGSVNNHNKFFSLALEGKHPSGVIINKSLFNQFYGLRFEMYNATSYLQMDANAQSNSFLNCYTLVEGLITNKITDSGQFNRITGADYRIGDIEYHDGVIYEYVKAGNTYTRVDIETLNSGVTRQSIGTNAYYLISNATGTLNIDLSKGDHFDIRVTGNITAITFTNIPSAGKEKTLSFIQPAGGATISGFPTNFLGQIATLPVSRANGRDIYKITRGASSATEMYAISQYRN